MLNLSTFLSPPRGRREEKKLCTSTLKRRFDSAAVQWEAKSVENLIWILRRSSDSDWTTRRCSCNFGWAELSVSKCDWVGSTTLGCEPATHGMNNNAVCAQVCVLCLKRWKKTKTLRRYIPTDSVSEEARPSLGPSARLVLFCLPPLLSVRVLPTQGGREVGAT